MTDRKSKFCALGIALREYRQTQGMTQQALADQLGMKSHAHISRIENGEVETNALLLHYMAKILGVTMDELFERVDALMEK